MDGPVLHLCFITPSRFARCFLGWQIQQDLDMFATLPEGKLTVDVLAGSCVHSESGLVNTYIAGEISSWFKHQITERGIPLSDIMPAMLHVELARSPTSKKKRSVTFDWRGSGCIKTDAREYNAELAESHSWHGKT